MMATLDVAAVAAKVRPVFNVAADSVPSGFPVTGTPVTVNSETLKFDLNDCVPPPLPCTTGGPPPPAPLENDDALGTLPATCVSVRVSTPVAADTPFIAAMVSTEDAATVPSRSLWRSSRENAVPAFGRC